MAGLFLARRAEPTFPWASFLSAILLAFAAVCGFVSIGAGQALAQAAIPQACEQSRLVTTAPGQTCFYREEAAGNGACVVKTYSARLKRPDAGSQNYFYRLREPTPANLCFMSATSPQQQIDAVKTVDPVMTNGHDWSPARTLSDATVATFINQAGKRCVAFQKHGPPSRAGFAWWINGFYCEPPSAGPVTGPIPDVRIQAYLDMARPRN